MPVEITRRSFIGASALALACITPLAGCSSGGSSSSASSNEDDDIRDSTSSEQFEPSITVSGAKWEHMPENENWLRCTGTVTNNTDEDIGKYDILVNHTRRYKDKYGETVEEDGYFRASHVVTVIAGSAVAQVAEDRYGYPGYETYPDNFMDLRAHESVDFDFIVEPSDWVFKDAEDVEFLDPSFEATVISRGPAVIDYGEYADKPWVVDSLNDFDVEVSGGKDLASAIFNVTNNTGKYIDRGELYVTYHYTGDVYNPGSGYNTGYKSFSLMKPGDTIEVRFDDSDGSKHTLITPICVQYHVDESK